MYKIREFCHVRDARECACPFQTHHSKTRRLHFHCVFQTRALNFPPILRKHTIVNLPLTKYLTLKKMVNEIFGHKFQEGGLFLGANRF